MDKKEKIILLIDPDSEEYCVELLSLPDNYQLIIKTSHRDAFEFFINNHFYIALVLLCHMPDFPCTELLRYLKLVEPSIPVIIITDYGSEELAATVFRMGASDYLKKSSFLHELQVSLNKLLNLKTSNIRGQRGTIYSLYRAVEYINENYCSSIRLCNVAKEAGMSISCFERTFKNTMGMNFSAYINKLRIAKAAGMLYKTNYAISEIAFACGYTNQFHFSRTFKKIMKTPPMIYRKNLFKSTLKLI